MPARWVVLLIAGLLSLFVAACGGDEGGGGGGEEVQGAEPLPADAAEGASGNVTLCVPKDVSGAYNEILKAHNRQSDVKARLLELPESADEQRQQQVQRLEAESPECDVLGIDVIWTAEYASQGWIRDVTEVIEQRRDEFIESTIETARYDDRYWAVPFNSNAGLLYYRTDQTREAPQTWQEVYDAARRNDGLVYQGAPYEGLTVNFLELFYAAGGQVLSEDGRSSAIDSQEARDVVAFMAEGVQGRAVPRAVVTYREEEARRAFQAGRASFMRNWPYAYALAQDSRIEGKFDISPLPGWEDKPGAGVLGGTNLAISAYSQNPGGALEVVNFYTSEEGQRIVGESATPPVTIAAYREESVRKAIGLPDEIRQGVQQAQPRPVSPVYTQISQAIYKNVNQALTGRVEPDAAVRQMDQEVSAALETF